MGPGTPLSPGEVQVNGENAKEFPISSVGQGGECSACATLEVGGLEVQVKMPGSLGAAPKLHCESESFAHLAPSAE